jgi:nitrous oxide reductase accessory protein NosL
MRGFLVMKFLFLGFLVFFMLGCENKVDRGVAKVHWDRDMCARCVMVVSDRHNTTQVIDPKTGKKYMFDDIGCMVLWFEDENIEWKNEAIIWITDVDTGEWIDARKAYYDTNNITPMAYGFSAHKSKESIKEGEEIIEFDEVVKRVKKIGK